VLVELFDGLVSVPLDPAAESRQEAVRAAESTVVPQPELPVASPKDLPRQDLTFATEKNFSGTRILTRQEETAERVRYRTIRITLDPDLKNHPATSDLFSVWKIYIGDDVTPRDIFRYLGIDDAAQISLFHQENITHEMREGNNFISVLPNGPAPPWMSRLRIVIPMALVRLCLRRVCLETFDLQISKRKKKACRVVKTMILVLSTFSNARLKNFTSVGR